MINHLDIINREEDDFTCTGVLYDSKGEVVKEIFDDGKSLKEFQNEKFTIIVDERAANTKGNVRDKISGFVQDAGGVLIISDKACKFFNDLGIANLEYFDLVIKGKKKEITTHKLVNIVGNKIDCINKEKSKIKYWKTNVDKIEYLELDETKIPNNLSIFLLAGFADAQIFLRQELTDRIKQELTGFFFIPASEYIRS